RLSGSVEPVFLERMGAAFPDRIKKIINRMKELRGGKLSEGQFFKRHAGAGAYWDVIERLFAVGYRKAGFQDQAIKPVPRSFRRPGPAQTELFAEGEEDDDS
ncbi:MAG: radical SAM protein, partial [Nitrospiraceae bacterium]